MTENTKTRALVANDNIGYEGAYSSMQNFEAACRMAKSLTSSTIVPKDYMGEQNLGNAVIALEIAQRIGTSPLMVMQNLYIVHGKPGWSAQYVIASLNSCGKFSPLRFELSSADADPIDMRFEGAVWEGGQKSRITKEYRLVNQTCRAWATELRTGDRLDGPEVSINMAVQEGWYHKDGSKWQTMPDLMLHYRSASFFGKLYAPEIMMGMQTAEELSDVIDIDPNTGEVLGKSKGGSAEIMESIKEKQPEASVAQPFDEVANQINAAETFDELDKAGELAGGLPTAAEKKKARVLYAKRKKALKTESDQAPAFDEKELLARIAAAETFDAIDEVLSVIVDLSDETLKKTLKKAYIARRAELSWKEGEAS